MKNLKSFLGFNSPPLGKCAERNYIKTIQSQEKQIEQLKKELEAYEDVEIKDKAILEKEVAYWKEKALNFKKHHQ